MISAAGRSYKILSGLVNTTHVPQDLTCIHCLSSFIYTDVLCLVPTLFSCSPPQVDLHIYIQLLSIPLLFHTHVLLNTSLKDILHL